MPPDPPSMFGCFAPSIRALRAFNFRWQGFHFSKVGSYDVQVWVLIPGDPQCSAEERYNNNMSLCVCNPMHNSGSVMCDQIHLELKTLYA